jgi:hypothetical protein
MSTMPAGPESWPAPQPVTSATLPTPPSPTRHNPIDVDLKAIDAAK